MSAGRDDGLAAAADDVLALLREAAEAEAAGGVGHLESTLTARDLADLEVLHHGRRPPQHARPAQPRRRFVRALPGVLIVVVALAGLVLVVSAIAAAAVTGTPATVPAGADPLLIAGMVLAVLATLAQVALWVHEEHDPTRARRRRGGGSP